MSSRCDWCRKHPPKFKITIRTENTMTDTTGACGRCATALVRIWRLALVKP